MIHEGWRGLKQCADRDTAEALYYEILEIELDWIDPNSDDWLYNTGILEQIRWSLRERGFTHLKTSQNAPTIDLGWSFPTQTQRLAQLAFPESQLELESFADDSGLALIYTHLQLPLHHLTL